MEKIRIKMKRLYENVKVPIYATSGSAGFDFYSFEDVVLLPGETKKVSTGVSVEIPFGFYLRIEDRSGLAFKGVHKVAGIIDSDYRGEIFIVLHNASGESFMIEKNDRIAQGILSPVFQTEFSEVEELSETERNKGGFHSTGRK